MPTFCRHNRFVERCPICSKELAGPDAGGSSSSARAPRRGAAGARPAGTVRRRAGGAPAGGVRVRREARADDDGYRSELVPGLRASADAERLAQELAFSAARLLALAADPPGLYREIRDRAGEDLEWATWACFLTAYLSPTEGEEPFAGIRRALAAGSPHGAPALAAGEGALPDLDGIELGPRSSHDPARGEATLVAYLQWVQRSSSPEDGPAPDPAPRRGAQERAFTADAAWTPARRFERLFERLALPGLSRAARYDLLVTQGRLGLYPLAPDALHVGAQRGVSAEDPATLAAKRVFGIADTQLLERRASALAAQAGVPLEALDLALANWSAPRRATLGMPPDAGSEAALESVRAAFGL